MFGVYNRRRRLTAQSSGKQQAVCTAVRAARMVCPEEGHFVRFQKRKFFARAMGAVSRVSRQLRCPKVSKGRAESPLVRPQAHTPCPGWGPDAPTTARMVGLPPRVGQYFLSKRKKVPKKARGTATLAARPAMRNSQISAFRALPCPALVFAQACQSLTAFGSCAHWAHAPSRPKLRSAGAERLDAPNKFGASNSGP